MIAVSKHVRKLIGKTSTVTMITANPNLIPRNKLTLAERKRKINAKKRQKCKTKEN